MIMEDRFVSHSVSSTLARPTVHTIEVAAAPQPQPRVRQTPTTPARLKPESRQANNLHRHTYTKIMTCKGWKVNDYSWTNKRRINEISLLCVYLSYKELRFLSAEIRSEILKAFIDIGPKYCLTQISNSRLVWQWWWCRVRAHRSEQGNSISTITKHTKNMDTGCCWLARGSQGRHDVLLAITCFTQFSLSCR